MKRLWLLFLLVGGWLGVVVVTAAPASAHVSVDSTAPADGTRLGQAPDQVTIRLSENVGVQPGALRVIDEHNTPVTDGPVFQPGTEGEVLAIRLRPGLGAGSYLVEYAFVSADSHPVRGSFAFVVGDGPLRTPSGAVAASNGTDGIVYFAHVVVRSLSFGGVVLLGGLVFVLAVRPAGRSDPWVRELVRYGGITTSVSALAAFTLAGPYVTGVGLPAVFSGALLETTLDTSNGKLLLLRAVAAMALTMLAGRLLVPPETMPERLRFRYENIAMVAGFVVLLSYSASGHAVADPLPFVAIFANLAHFGAVAIWAGGVVQVAILLLRPVTGEDTGGVLARFSPFAAVSVAVVAVTGAYLSWRSVGSFTALWTTDYGRLVLLKIVGLGALLGIANIGRVAVRRHAVSSSSVATATRLSTLRRTVTQEVIIAVAVLVVAALLSSTAPAVTR